MAMSDYLEAELLDHIFGIGAWTAPTNRYIALLKESSADNDTPAANATKEVQTPGSNGYSRQIITVGAGAGGTNQVSNDTQLTFGPATSDWQSVSHAWLVDNSAAGVGNVLFHGNLGAAKDAGVSDTIVFAAGEIDISLD